MRIVKLTAYLIAALIAGWGIHGIVTSKSPTISATEPTAIAITKSPAQGH
jgi:hypothetical protein